MPEEYEFIKNLQDPKQKDREIDQLSSQDKRMALVFIDAIKYIYETKEFGKPQNYSFETWINDPSVLQYTLPRTSETRIKTFLKDFYDKFDEYKNFDCFKAMLGFSVSYVGAYKGYKEATKEGRVFNMTKFLDLVLKQKEKLKDSEELEDSEELKSPEELKSIPSSTNENLANSLLYFSSILDQYGDPEATKKAHESASAAK